MHTVTLSSGPLGHALESDDGDDLGNRRLGTAEVPGDIATGNNNANAIKAVGLGGTRETRMVSPLYMREYTPLSVGGMLGMHAGWVKVVS